jgi:hypothetical protein
MTGIDTVAAAILASRIDSLLNTPVTAPSAGAATPQVGTSATASGTAAPAPLPAGAAGPPLASAQAVLSEVALTLDAISRFGGEASAPVLGNAPLLPSGPSPQAATAQQPAAAGGAPADAAARAQASGGAPASPAAALSSALVQAVADSGLFYESHLAQWLAGQRSFAMLAREPQAQFADDGVFASARPGGAQPAPDDPLAEALAARLPLPQAGRPAGDAGAQTQGASAAPQNPAQSGAGAPPARAAGAYGTPEPDAKTLSSSATQGATRGEASADPPASLASSLHPATLPIVRQQLDLLATDQFRWIGEVWPGARLDWLIEPDDTRGRDPGAADPGDGIAWRTRLTLALPSLGMVDADLTLNGEQITARLRANETGAARLSSHGEQLRQRLAAAGLQLSGLSIRAIEDAPESFDTAAAHAAASAYARSAVVTEVLPAEPKPKQPARAPVRDPLDDWELLP